MPVFGSFVIVSQGVRASEIGPFRYLVTLENVFLSRALQIVAIRTQDVGEG